MLALVAILEDSTLKGEISAQAPEGIGVHVHHKQRALRRMAVNALRRQLRDASRFTTRHETSITEPYNPHQ